MNESTSTLGFRLPYMEKVQLMNEAVEVKMSLAEYISWIVSKRKEHDSMNNELKRILGLNEALNKKVKEYDVQLKKIEQEAEKRLKNIKDEYSIKVEQSSTKVKEHETKIKSLETLIESYKSQLSTSKGDLSKEKTNQSKIENDLTKINQEVTRLKRIIDNANDILKANDFRTGKSFLESGTPYTIKY